MPIPPLLKSSFTLDTSGVAGFFGEDEAVAAMASVHLFAWRKYLGWYNSPGSYKTAKCYGKLARSRIWKGLYPASEKEDVVKLFELGGKSGPRFVASQSGTRLDRTGYLAHLFIKKCTDLPVSVKDTFVGRKTAPENITVIRLPKLDEVDADQPTTIKPIFSPWMLLSAAIPISASIGTCVVCGVYREWYACAMILLGIVANGIACLVLGGADLKAHHAKPAKGCPAGDGVLLGDKEIVILLGEEAAVNYLTRGHFSLEYHPSVLPQHHDIGVSAFLLTIQFVLQLLLIPQASLFGQILFLASLGVSWIYNSCVSSLNREDIQTKLLADHALKLNISPKSESIWKCTFGNHTAMVAFMLCVLSPDQAKAKVLLDDQLPDNQQWTMLKEGIIEGMMDSDKGMEKVHRWQTEGSPFFKTLGGDVATGFEQYEVWKQFESNKRTRISKPEDV